MSNYRISDLPATTSADNNALIEISNYESGSYVTRKITKTNFLSGISGLGDVTGPSSSTDGHIVQFNGATGKIIKDGLAVVTTLGSPGSDTNIPTEKAVRSAITGAGGGDVSGPASSTDNGIVLFNGTGGKTIKDGAKTIVTTLGSDDTTLPTSKAVKDVTDTLLPKSGGTMTGALTLDEVQLGEKSMKLDVALSADGKRCGITESGTGGETLAFGDLCYFKAADSKRWKAKADSTTTSGPVKMGFCVLAGASTTTEILLFGKIRADAKFPTLTIGAPAFVSGATAGEIVTTAPTTTDYVTRIVGYGNTADELYVQIDNTYYTHT